MNSSVTELPKTMRSLPGGEPEETAASTLAPADVSGRDRLVTNVLSSWASYLVYVIAGFVLPRMMSDRLGPDALGVWDFGWSVVAYFGLVQGGIVSSINRYVARYRAADDWQGLNRAVSSVSCILMVMAFVVVLLSIGAALLLPTLFLSRLGEYVGDSQWVVIFLGAALAFELASGGFGGVLTGFHRWDIHNAVHAGTYTLSVFGMLVMLLAGAGLPWLALMHAVGELVGRSARCVIAYRLCPKLHVRISHARWAQAKEMLTFGGKSFVPQVAELILNQTTSVLVLAYLGPAALAVYSRPRALVRHLVTFVAKFAMVFTPTASSLDVSRRQDELQRLLIDAGRWTAYIALPVVLLFVIQGGPLLRVWMGSKYEVGAPVLVILALGSFTTVAQMAVRNILTGVNAHGRPGVGSLLASIVSLALSVLLLGTAGWGLIGAAIAVTVPPAVVNGWYVPWYACRRFHVSFTRYVIHSLRGPTLCSLPFAGCLVGGKLLFPGHSIFGLLTGLGLGSVVLGVLYYRFVIPTSLRDRILAGARRLRVGGRRGALPGGDR